MSDPDDASDVMLALLATLRDERAQTAALERDLADARALAADALRVGLEACEAEREWTAMALGERALFEPHGDHAATWAQLAVCAGAWDPLARLVGNVRAGDIAVACVDAAEVEAERDALRTHAAALLKHLRDAPCAFYCQARLPGVALAYCRELATREYTTGDDVGFRCDACPIGDADATDVRDLPHAPALRALAGRCGA